MKYREDREWKHPKKEGFFKQLDDLVFGQVAGLAGAETGALFGASIGGWFGGVGAMSGARKGV